MFMRFKIEDDVDRNSARLQWLSAHHLVQIEGNAFSVAHRIHHHQRLTCAQLHNVACRKKVRVTQTSEAIDLDGPAFSS